MMRLLAVAVLAAALAGPLWAQAPAAPPAPAPAASASPAPEGADPIRSLLEQEVTPAPGAYTYTPQGRRDPFVSLQRPVAAERGTRARRPGLDGMLIQEVALRGVVKNRDGLIAMLQGADGKSYFAKIGQRLADGGIIDIDASSVTFRQEINDPLSVLKSRDVKKSLYQTEEARQ